MLEFGRRRQIERRMPKRINVVARSCLFCSVLLWYCGGLDCPCIVVSGRLLVVCWKECFNCGALAAPSLSLLFVWLWHQKIWSVCCPIELSLLKWWKGGDPQIFFFPSCWRKDGVPFVDHIVIGFETRLFRTFFLTQTSFSSQPWRSQQPNNWKLDRAIMITSEQHLPVGLCFTYSVRNPCLMDSCVLDLVTQ